MKKEKKKWLRDWILRVSVYYIGVWVVTYWALVALACLSPDVGVALSRLTEVGETAGYWLEDHIGSGY